jgi:hypothetical protein
MNHRWTSLPDTKEEAMPVHKNWKCKVCGCEKSLGQTGLRLLFTLVVALYTTLTRLPALMRQQKT